MSSEQNDVAGQVAIADIGFRLRQERERLKLSVAGFAVSVGVTDRSQRNYEAGLRLPDVGYLLEALKLGVDTDFILTGIDSAKRKLDEISRSTPAEKMILEEVLRIFDTALSKSGVALPPDKRNACILNMYLTGRYGGPVTVEVADELIALAAR